MKLSNLLTIRSRVLEQVYAVVTETAERYNLPTTAAFSEKWVIPI
ncbi:MAG: hypothetical protein WCF03_02345 [Nitrososphaeraceae archaeon]